MVFFVSVLFIVTGVLNAIPEFTDQVVQNRLETQAWSLSTVILSTPGYWKNISDDGTSWERKTEYVRSFGLESEERPGLEREKIQALDSIAYSEMKRILATEFDFSMDFTEYMVVDTSVPESDIPSEVNIPSEYDGQRLNYGSKRVEGEGYYFLVHGFPGDYNVSISGTRDFSQPEGELNIDIDGSGTVDFGARQYSLDIPNSGVYESEGNMVVLQTSIQRIGRRTPPDPGEVVSIRRFSNIEENVVRMDMRMWMR